jgi:pimeloyl-ACP methyl ester carboxylesterase
MTLHHVVRGSGPAVLLVHAGVADARMWADVAEALAAGRRVVACDLRGFGRTPLTPGRFSNAEDILGLLDELGIERAAVVGASYGGRVALELALRAPERVSALGLIDAAIGEPFDWSPEIRAFGEAEDAALEAGDIEAAVELNVRTWVDGPRRSPGTVDPAVRDLVAAMQRDAFHAQLGVDADDDELDPPVAGRLHEVRAPALVMVGEHDVADFHRIAERLVAELPGATPLVTIADAAHLPAVERPGAVADALAAFLAEHA